jgi:hypothetical protein
VARGEVTEDEDPDLFLRVLGDAVGALDQEDLPHAVFGSIAAAVYGRPTASGDIDFLVQPGDADRALKALARAGFDTEETDPSWIYKGVREGVLVDVIFKVRGGLYLDDEMLAHVRDLEYRRQPVRLVSPEDALLIEAFGTDDQVPGHWFSALAILAATPLDWDYLIHRARYGSRRVLSLLAYADSEDYVVPQGAIRAAFDLAYSR